APLGVEEPLGATEPARRARGLPHAEEPESDPERDPRRPSDLAVLEVEMVKALEHRERLVGAASEPRRPSEAIEILDLERGGSIGCREKLVRVVPRLRGVGLACSLDLARRVGGFSGS